MIGKFLERKETLFDYKKHGFNKGQKLEFFLKGFVHCFCEKIKIFPSFVLMQNGSIKSVW